MAIESVHTRQLPPENKLWSTQDAAYYLNIHIDTVKQKARCRQIPTAGKIGAQWRFRKSSLDTWLWKEKTKTGGH